MGEMTHGRLWGFPIISASSHFVPAVHTQPLLRRKQQTWLRCQGRVGLSSRNAACSNANTWGVLWRSSVRSGDVPRSGLAPGVLLQGWTGRTPQIHRTHYLPAVVMPLSLPFLFVISPKIQIFGDCHMQS